jgi:CBS domain-containing protein
MNRDVATISPDANLVEAATIMRARDIGFLPVIKGK